MSELFLGDPNKQSGHILKEKVGLHLHSRALPGSLSFATPEKEYKALDQNLAVLFWAKAGINKRVRITDGELRDLLGVKPTDPFVSGNVTHCLSGAGDKFAGKPRIWRVYLTTTSESKTVEQVAAIVTSATEFPVVSSLIKSRAYGVLVLCETPQKRTAVERAIVKHKISRQALIEVAVGPTAATISKAFKKSWESHND